VVLLDKLVFSLGVFALMVGLVFEASGFGVFIAGHIGGLLLLVLGVSMYWAGWVISGAQSFSCAVAAALNMFDAASTLAFWNYEVNPAVLYLGPTLFLIAKIACSIAIVAYARFHVSPRKGGIVLSVVFGGIVGWNLSQHALAYFELSDVTIGLLFGAFLSFVVSAIILTLLLEEKSSETSETIR
jgi:hypothetical protein